MRDPGFISTRVDSHVTAVTAHSVMAHSATVPRRYQGAMAGSSRHRCCQEVTSAQQCSGMLQPEAAPNLTQHWLWQSCCIQCQPCPRGRNSTAFDKL